MKPVLSIYFIRNGQTSGNLNMRLQGQNDGELSEIGKKQAVLVGNELKKIETTKVYSSPLGRARFTCEAADLGLEPTFLDDLKERNFGDVTNMTYFDMIDFAPNYRPPNGESLVDMQVRVSELLHFFTKEHEVGQNIVAFAHHEVILSCVAYVNQMPLEKFRSMMISNCSITQLDFYDNHWVIKRVNELGHLEELKQTRRVY